MQMGIRGFTAVWYHHIYFDLIKAYLGYLRANSILSFLLKKRVIRKHLLSFYLQVTSAQKEKEVDFTSGDRLRGIALRIRTWSTLGEAFLGESYYVIFQLSWESFQSNSNLSLYKLFWIEWFKDRVSKIPEKRWCKQETCFRPLMVQAQVFIP